MTNNITLNINIIEAKDLLANDSNGFSDPFVIIPDNQQGVYNIPKKGYPHNKKNIKSNLE